MVDTHCHLYEVDSLIGVEDLVLIICNGAGDDTNKKALKMATEYENVYATAGYHPEDLALGQLPAIDGLKNWIVDNPKIVAVGECGLDFYEKTTEEEKEWQKLLLKMQVDLAIKLQLPLVVHCRAAFGELFKILDYDRVQMHCFTGSEEEMRECVSRGWYISFGGILTFKNDGGLRNVAKSVPKELLLTETDAPWLSPEPFRGQKNTPIRVKYVLEMLAKVRDENIKELEKKIEQNARSLFGL